MKWWEPSKPNEIKPIPWLAPRVIEYLESLLTPDMNVIEHGSGGSTLWFAERCKFIAAYEDNIDWCKAMQRRLKNKSNQQILPLGYPPLGIAPYLKFDLLLIDGEPVADRAQWIKDAPKLVRPGGWVVLDNANRPEYATERKWLQGIAESFETFDCNEGTAYLVTEFYKMKG